MDPYAFPRVLCRGGVQTTRAERPPDGHMSRLRAIDLPSRSIRPTRCDDGTWGRFGRARTLSAPLRKSPAGRRRSDISEMGSGGGNRRKKMGIDRDTRRHGRRPARIQIDSGGFLPFDAEPRHAALEGRRFEAEALGGATGSSNPPVRAFEHAANMLDFQVGQRHVQARDRAR